MKRREFVAAGLAGLGAVSVAGSAMAATADSSLNPASPASGASWDGQVRPRGAAPASESVSPTGEVTVHADAEAMAQREAVAAELTALVAPLRGGSQLDAGTLREVYVDEWGTGVALVESSTGRMYRLDICRRDGDVAEPLARTAGYELYVRNGADGDAPSDREVVLAARALAGVIENNERGAEVALVSKQQYWRPDYFG